MNGIPDLILLKDGVTIFVEVKAKKGRLSKVQEYRIQQLTEAGFEVRVEKNKI